MQHTFLSHILPTLPTPDAFGNAPVYYSVGLGYSYPQQTPHSSIQSLIDRCNALSNAGLNAYMALGSFRDPTAGRKQANALEFKSIWADIDVGKQSCKYQTQQEAKEALCKFIVDTALIPTYVVSSGAGLHVYWCFEKNVAAPLWKQVASLFQQLCNQQGLDIDPARATDTASVLRLPGTVHTKTGNVVTIVHRCTDNTKPEGKDTILYQPRSFTELVVKHLGTVQVAPAPVAPPPVVAGSTLSEAMGFGPTEPTADAEKIARNCPQVLAMGQQAYPSWFAAMSVLRRCTNGIEWAHKLSALCPEKYDQAVTERRFYEANPDSPCRCDTFERLNPSFCGACKYKGRVKSPVQLDRIAAPVVKKIQNKTGDLVAASDGHLVFPEGWNSEYTYMPRGGSFEVDDTGIVAITVNKNKQGQLETQRETICHSKLYFKHSELTLDDDRPQRSYMFDAYHPSGDVETVRYIVDEDNGPQNTMNWFNNAKMYPARPNISGQVFMNFMNAYLNAVLHGAKEIRTFKQYGWIEDFMEPNSKEPTIGFLTGDGVITSKGIYEAGYGKDASKTRKNFGHAGTLASWKESARLYKELDQKICQLAMCFGFASPLMKYSIVEARNCLFNVWSDKGGKGKSCMLRMVASIWGDPMEAFFGKDSTFPSTEFKLMLWNNMPAMLDELTSASDENMANLAFAICSGRQRSKMLKGGLGLADTGDWETCTFTTANKSFKECIARRHADTDAATKRVMDYEWDCKVYDDDPAMLAHINARMENIENNYGYAGPEFIYQLLTHPEKLAGLRKFIGDWAVAHGFAGDERFMAHPLAAAIQAGRWAVEFGLLDYDMDALEKWVLEVFVPHNRKQTAALAPDFKEMMVEYLNDRAASHTLMVKSAERGPKEIDPGAASMPDPYVLRQPMRELYARYERDTQQLWVMRSDFHNWCKQKRVPPSLILKDLEDKGIKVEAVTARLARNVSCWTIPRSKCYTFKADALNKLGYTDMEN